MFAQSVIAHVSRPGIRAERRRGGERLGVGREGEIEGEIEGEREREREEERGKERGRGREGETLS